MLKVATIVGTRPEIIRLSRIIAKFDTHFDHTLIHTGQNYDYELNQVFFEQLNVRAPDHFMHAAGNTAAETIGNVIIASDRILGEVKPDALLILGDTNSSLAAIAAKRRKIPIFHMEAGNRCFDARVPEEINRKIVDHTADINLTYSTIAREYLLREGFPPDQVIRTGSPLREVLDYYRAGIAASTVLSDLCIQPKQYFIVSSHREENVDSLEKLKKLLFMLNELADRYDLPIIVSTHPRTRNRLAEISLRMHDLVQFRPPFGFLDYVNLESHAKAVLSDSGTITEESSLLNFPALNLREVHERPEGFEEAAVMMVGLDVERILAGLEILESQPRGSERALPMVVDYTPENVSEKMLRIVLSYTDFVNRRIWRR